MKQNNKEKKIKLSKEEQEEILKSLNQSLDSWLFERLKYFSRPTYVLLKVEEEGGISISSIGVNINSMRFIEENKDGETPYIG